MSVLQFSLPCIRMDASFRDPPLGSPLYARLTVVGIVVLLHLSLFAAWLLQPEQPQVAVNEMSISFATVQMRQADITPPPPKPKPKPKKIELVPKPMPKEIVEPKPVPTDESVVKEETPTVMEETSHAPQDPSPPSAQSVSPPSPVVLDAEPDYRADYLNNPRPPYPMVARRMGYHGKVVLNVEVLAEGKAGQVLLHQSSGYEILDNAALQTVKSWRFSPARRFGQPLTLWFLVPIKFSLEDNEA
ncbi:MAG: energy transducer TonB [Sideroxyarcus sp.]|nr:energy transducer TonB [Sideroxyarcus sp.]